MIPYSVITKSTGDAREIGFAIAAAELIDSYVGQPLHRRHATMRFDLFEGSGLLPCPLHNLINVRVNGVQVLPADYGISGSSFQLAGARPQDRHPRQHLVEIDGVMGYGEVRGLTGLTVVGTLMTAMGEADVIPLGSVLYNSGSPVYVEAVSGLEMTISGTLLDVDDPQLLTPPQSLRKASDALRQDIAIAASRGDTDSKNKTALFSDDVKALLSPFVARYGGRSSYAPVTGTPGFPQEEGAFGAGFGRGFD